MNIPVEKPSGTYADSLAAIGYARALSDLGLGAVNITDQAAHFVVSSPDDLTDITSVSPGFPYVWDSAKEPERPAFPSLLNYQTEKAKREAWNKFQTQRSSARRTRTQLAEQDLSPPPQPHPEIGTAVLLASMRKGWDSDRKLARWLTEDPDRARNWVASNLGLPHEPVDPPEFSNTQILNPISGKGGNAPKTEFRLPGSLPRQLIDPFREWMKWRGLWTAMLLYRSGEDFKFFVIEPKDIRVEALSSLRTRLQQMNIWGGVRLDIEATFRCAQLLISNSDVAGAAAPLVALRGRRPNQVISGLRVSFFKSLGTAPALMNDAFFPLPSWFPVETREDAEDFLAIIAEAIGSVDTTPRSFGCLGSLQEKNSDDGAILQDFRQWLLTSDLGDLLAFHARFAVHLMQKLGAKDWASPFSTGYLDKLLIKGYSSVKDIVQNEGFRHLARAIRNSTIYAVRKDSRREVHFGLAQRWKQKLKSGPAEFLAELSAFAQSYNWEVVHRLEGKGFLVSTGDLDSIVDLCETHGAELVGSLLLAYGYAMAPAVKDDPESQPAATK